jgi:hypothetical protein
MGSGLHKKRRTASDEQIEPLAVQGISARGVTREESGIPHFRVLNMQRQNPRVS